MQRFVGCCTGLGLPSLYDELRERVDPETFVGLYRWNDYSTIIHDLRTHKPTEIFFFCHSYGASLSNFVCCSLAGGYPHVRVRHLVWADPIWRREIGRITRESLDHTKAIRIPPNVEAVDTFRQQRGPIQGHALEVSPPTVWTDTIVTDRRHAFMDRLPEFRTRCLEVLELA